MYKARQSELLNFDGHRGFINTQSQRRREVKMLIYRLFIGMIEKREGVIGGKCLLK